MDHRPAPVANNANRQQQLLALASERGLALRAPKPLLDRPNGLALPQYATAEHYDLATKLLANARKHSDNYKDPSKRLVNRFKSQSKKERLDRAENWDFSVEERCVLLEQNIREKGDVGVAQALLEYKQDNLFKVTSNPTSPASKIVKRFSKNTEEPETWLPTAVNNGNVPHVILLASRGPSSSSLNSAFEAAMSSRSSIAITEELLRHGADPNGHHDAFMVFVRQKNLDFVEALLRSPLPMQPLYLNTALIEAVRGGNIDLVALLLAYGADPNYQEADSFLATVRASNLDMTYVLLVAPREPVRLRSEYLDHAVSIIAEGHERDKQRHDFFGALLCAGASPNSRFMEDELFTAVRSSNMETIKLLVSYGTSVDHDNARCFRAALESQDLGLLDILLCGHLSPAALSKAVPQAMKFTAREQRLHAMRLLLSKGVAGLEVDQALVDAIRQEDSKLFNELYHAKVDVNYHGGLALHAAYQARNPAYLQCLCDRASIEFSTAARMIPVALDPKTYQESRSAMLLKACRSHSSIMDKALTDEIVTHGAREDIIRILLENGASVEASNGAALYQAALAGKQRAVQQLVAAEPSHLVLHSAFRAAMSLTEVSSRFSIMKILLEAAGAQKIGQDDALLQEASNAAFIGTDIVDLLLKHKASVDYHDGDGIRAAINSKSYATLQLLLACHPSKDTLTTAFTQCMGLPQEFRVKFVTLIGEEAHNSHMTLPVGLSLGQAVAENDIDLTKLLLRYGADPNDGDGNAFIDAARLPNTQIFEELLAYRPDIKRLLPGLIRELDNEETVISCLQLCFERLQIQLKPSENVLLFLALDQFEQGDKLIDFLLQAGCSPGTTRELQLRPGGDIEPVTPLIWALSRPLPGPSRAVILTILERGAEGKPDYVTPTTNTNALLEAAKTGRHAIVSKLISLDAKVNAQDTDGNSALLLASECGDLASVEALLQARVKPNDGSLHAAARGAYERIVRLLLENGHTPNHIHEGRNALAELCRNGHSEGVDWNERSYWVIDVLIERGTKLEARFAGKNLIHLALDNDMPLPILKVLLDFPQFSEHLNDESFLFEDATGTVFSPLSYAETFHSGPPSEKAKLLKLLEDKNCARNMWNRQGRHPPNYTYNTMPAHLKAMVDQEKLEELKHAKELQRRQEEARVERELADRNHKHLVDQALARHRLEAVEIQQREAREAAADMRRREAENRHKHELAAAEAQSLREKHQLEINQQATLAMQRQQIEDRDRAREFQHQKQMNSLETQRENERIASQKALAWEQDRANEQQHVRQLQLLDRQDQSVKVRANEMRSVANAARAANTNIGIAGPSGRPPKQIGFGDDWATVD